MNLLDEYELAIQSGKIYDVPSQRTLVTYFQQVVNLLQRPPARRGWFSLKPNTVEKGIYLHGTVGSGKTFLMDLLYYHVRSPNKARYHFHHFMQYIDGQLRHLQGKKNPLQQIAADLARHVRLLCLDEMLVQDVAHAMMLADLFQALFKHGVIMVCTSNTAPDDLYKNGIQRTRFLPAIELIKQHCEILTLESDRDFRLQHAAFWQAYNYPLGNETDKKLQEQFQAWGGTVMEGGTIEIQNRSIPFVARTEKTIWFEFDVLCNLPRSQLDYLEIANRFSAITISNIPILSADAVQTVLLKYLVDILYDQKIQLMLSATAPLEDLLVWNKAGEGLQRTFSRLKEMQSKAWQTEKLLN